jgi:hypothetical protein
LAQIFKGLVLQEPYQIGRRPAIPLIVEDALYWARFQFRGTFINATLAGEGEFYAIPF